VPADVLGGVWAGVGGDPAAVDRVVVSGPAQVLPSPFLVTPAATAAIGAATLAVAELADLPGPVGLDTVHASAAVRCERYASITGVAPPPMWDAVAGDYPAADGWIRLHTNYAQHRQPALAVLGVAPERDAVAAAVRTWPAERLEAEVVAAGGCAAALHTRDRWCAHDHGRRVGERPLVAIERLGEAPVEAFTPGGPAPLAGLRVLDLTRVFAGPVATRFLAAWGADVLRVEAPAFHELELLFVEVGFGKRSCALDLRTEADRGAFEALVAGADVVVHGYRPGALRGLGYPPEVLAALRPGLVVAGLSAYGAAGPWAERRGFDSLVQMSAGIAAEGATTAGADRPVPLPCQLLDHATGYLLALGALRAVQRRAGEGGAWEVTLSLARTAQWLDGLGRDEEGLARAEPALADADRWCLISATPWGDVRHLGPPGTIGEVRPGWRRPPSRPGADPPAW
jgi:hypothetical protein